MAPKSMTDDHCHIDHDHKHQKWHEHQEHDLDHNKHEQPIFFARLGWIDHVCFFVESTCRRMKTKGIRFGFCLGFPGAFWHERSDVEV